MSLFKFEDGNLLPVRRQALASEEQLERWIAKDPSIPRNRREVDLGGV